MSDRLVRRNDLSSVYNFGTIPAQAIIEDVSREMAGRDTARGFIKQARAVPGSMKYSAASLS